MGMWSKRRMVVSVIAAVAIGYAIQNGLAGPNLKGTSGRIVASKNMAIYAPDNQGIVFTQIPLAQVKSLVSLGGGTNPLQIGEGAHLAILSMTGKVRILTPDFNSAADPAVSFDGKRVLFAGKKSASDSWDIFEVNADGSGLRQITHEMGNCRTPIYQSALFYLNDPKPSYQITFASDVARELDGDGPSVSWNLYSMRMDGSGIRRLTYGITSSYDPFQMQDGRILFSQSQCTERQPSEHGRIDLFGIGLDGTDYAAFSAVQGKRIKRMACTTSDRQVVFVESQKGTWDGAGNLATLSLRRNFRSYRAITTPADLLFHSPSPLLDGSVLVSGRSVTSKDTHSIYRIDIETGRRELIFADPAFANVQPVVIAPRPEPDGHSSVVEDEQDWSKLYCLSIRHTDLKPEWMLAENAVRVRVVEGVPVVQPAGNHSAVGNGFVPRRLLGDALLDPDGSFHLSVPPNTTIQVQLLDHDGMALRSSSWFWTKNKENRGCIGCHEDHELAPENVFPSALGHPAAQLTLPVARRRTVAFRTDVMPVITSKCATPACHGGGTAPAFNTDSDARSWPKAYHRLLLPAGADGGPALVDPGSARTSRLIWAILGRNTSQPWDKTIAVKNVAKHMPPEGATPLTDDEKRILIEWIDLGAQLDPLTSSRSVASSGGQR